MMHDDAFAGCRSGAVPPSSCAVVSNPARLSSSVVHGAPVGCNVSEAAGVGNVHSVLVNRSVSGPLCASPAVKASGPFSSLTGLMLSDASSPRDTYPQRVQV